MRGLAKRMRFGIGAVMLLMLTIWPVVAEAETCSTALAPELAVAVDWCWDGSVVTSVDLSEPPSLVIAQRNIRGGEGLGSYVYLGVGLPVAHVTPWAMVTVRGDGTYSTDGGLADAVKTVSDDTAVYDTSIELESGAVMRSTTIQTSEAPDGVDKFVGFDGEAITSSSRSASTGEGGVSTSNMSQVGSNCMSFDNGDAYTYDCARKYSYSPKQETSADYNYRVWYWTGTSYAHDGADLDGVENYWTATAHKDHGAMDNWFPNGDIHDPNSGRTENLTLSVGAPGASGSVGISQVVYADVYGPVNGHVGSDQFGFGWFGEKDKSTAVGTAGGHQYKFRSSHNLYDYNTQVSTTIWTCRPDWWCQ